jgi:predicted ATPase
MRSARPDSRLITRVVLRNYKSIGACDVSPGSLTFLVGPNGSGKSNFLDSLRFVADSLRHSLDHALRDRGGINEVRRRSGGHPTHFGIRLEFRLCDSFGYYAFSVGARSHGAWAVEREECQVVNLGSADNGRPAHAHFRVDDGQVTSMSLRPAAAAVHDRLYLVGVSGAPEFRPLYDALSTMGFYNLNPDQIRDLQAPDPGDLLRRDGANLASVLSTLDRLDPETKERVEEYLARVVPGTVGVERKIVGPKETLEFKQEVKGAKHPWHFLAASMSDGTLRALGLLVALFQTPIRAGAPRLVGIEEPEVALHPAAAGILTDSLRDASRRVQVLVTSHSPDLLDDEEVGDDSILAVVAEQGETKIAPLDAAGRSALRDHLYTAGELLRMDQLRPDPAQIPADPDQLNLFAAVAKE